MKNATRFVRVAFLLIISINWKILVTLWTFSSPVNTRIMLYVVIKTANTARAKTIQNADFRITVMTAHLTNFKRF